MAFALVEPRRCRRCGDLETAFDSLLQRDGPDAARGAPSLGSRRASRWRGLALIGIIPQNEQLGLLLLAIVLASAESSTSVPGAPRPVVRCGRPSDPRRSTAVGRAARGLRSHSARAAGGEAGGIGGASTARAAGDHAAGGSRSRRPSRFRSRRRRSGAPEPQPSRRNRRVPRAARPAALSGARYG